MSRTDTIVSDFSDFVLEAPTAFHAAAAVRDTLASSGFRVLSELDDWPTEPGRYVVVRDGAVVAWRIPEGASSTTPFRIIGAHTDSPGFRLKPNPSMRSVGWEQLSVEVYGGPILSTWFDRDLRIAGRVVDADGGERLVATGAVARIANLAIHLDRGANDSNGIDRQRHLIPIVATDNSEREAGAWLADIVGRSAVSWDLSLADSQRPCRVGAYDEFLAATRMDNLTSVHAGLHALLHAEPSTSHIPILAAFDHEEIGSATPSGAQGPMLEEILQRIQSGLGASASDMARARRASWMVSSDAGHLVHPNYAEKHDPTNQPRPGGGPLLKISANQRYVTGAPGAALWESVCRRAGIAYQSFVNHNGVPGGSTIGPLASTRLGIPTVDVGVGLLSMHSIRELVHIDDLAALHAALRAFLD
ncbi:M18 family aminopeptidase [Curtobacterium ammoniigenes]|uniref:M18 family aminopeptidase n=1 Tax=Curtobacterium ammoniigenes TaxID=395387 RepID=UPI00082B94B1|nr:M18 family aminopeptidase [Curtobacterium ammoniigenes]